MCFDAANAGSREFFVIKMEIKLLIMLVLVHQTQNCWTTNQIMKFNALDTLDVCVFQTIQEESPSYWVYNSDYVAIGTYLGIY